MTRTRPEEAQDDLQSRGYCRRDMARLASVFGVGAMAASVGRPAWASGGVPDPAPSAKTRIGANECWTGPLMPGQIAAQKMVEHGNRYSPKDERGDFIKAMLAVDPNAWLYYICTPNNPTGTITPLEGIEWLIAHKPEGSMVLVDEAYTHFAGVPVASSFAPKYKDVIVMRTFSKIFGMAGMRMGYIMTQPANIAKMMRYDGGMQSGALPLPSLACATASLTAASLIAQRKGEMEAARGFTLDHLKKRGLMVIPTNANMLMIDWKTKPAKDMQAAFRTQSVEIGRSWPIWPTVSRVTVGSMEDMQNFAIALDKVWTV